MLIQLIGAMAFGMSVLKTAGALREHSTSRQSSAAEFAGQLSALEREPGPYRWHRATAWSATRTVPTPRSQRAAKRVSYSFRLIAILSLIGLAMRVAAVSMNYWRSRRQAQGFASQLPDADGDEATWDEINERQHVNPPRECWCQPDLILEAGNGVDDDFLAVWCHKGHGDELPTGRELAEAIRKAILGIDDG